MNGHNARVMKLLQKRDGRIRTKDDFLLWVKKKDILKKKRTAEQIVHAKALATWTDDGGQ